MTTLFDDELYTPVIETPLDVLHAIWALKEAWFRIFDEYPSPEALCVLTAQSALETGRWQKINNYNFGNLKRLEGKPFTMFATGENIWNNRLKKSEWHWFEPPHYQTAFRSYSNPIDGAFDYISFLSDRKCSETWRNEAYKKAFSFLRQGKPKEFSYALHYAGYYTANPEKYTIGVMRLYNEFFGKKDEFMTWKPDDYDTDPAPPPSSVTQKDIHDTDIDVEPTPENVSEKFLEIPEEEIDTEISNTIPEVPEVPKNWKPVLFYVLAGIGTLLAWLFGAC